MPWCGACWPRKPSDRYPTPGALLKDLIRLETATAAQTGPDVLAGLALAANERRRSRSDGQRAPSRPVARRTAAPFPPRPTR